MIDSDIQGDLGCVLEEKFHEYSVAACLRAIPDARDGMKPIHRRIVYTTLKNAKARDGHMVKSVVIAADTLSMFHPHGDKTVYDAAVRLSRSYLNRLPALDGHGNMGGIDGSSAAASRYTEMALNQDFRWAVLDGVDDVVPHGPNFDGQYTQPLLLPVKIPLLLVNGVPAGSIAVGWTSTIPPHNPVEVANACAAFIHAHAAGQELSMDELLSHMPGPDFPTGGVIVNPAEVRVAYETGDAKLRVRCRTSVESQGAGRGQRIIITEIPFDTTTSEVVMSITEAAIGKLDKKNCQRGTPTIPEVVNVLDESDQDPVTKETRVRIVVDLVRGIDVAAVLARLFAGTAMEVTFGVRSVAINESFQPQVYTALQLIEAWYHFRTGCVSRALECELSRLSTRIHILTGMLKSIAFGIPKVVAIVTASDSNDDARTALMTQVDLTSMQADAVLAMPVGSLTRMSMDKIMTEHTTLSNRSAEVVVMLTTPNQTDTIILSELEEVKRRFPDARRTTLGLV